MTRLCVLVEGHSEEAFFNRVLRPHLASAGVYGSVRMIRARPESTARSNKGGWNSYARARKDLLRWMREDPGARFSTMVDLYRIPKDFPRLAEAMAFADPYDRVAALEQVWLDDLDDEARGRFLPYIQLHEFEALILADPQKLDWEFLDHDRAIAALVAEVGSGNPELIDDGPETDPSRRIMRRIPEYEGQKASAGPLVADKIGLVRLRTKCPHFHQWVERLERPAASAGAAPPGP